MLLLCSLCREVVEAARLGPTGIVVIDPEPDALGRLALMSGTMLRIIPDGEPSQSAQRIHERDAARMLLRRYSEHSDTCTARAREKPTEMVKTRPGLPSGVKGVRRDGR